MSAPAETPWLAALQGLAGDLPGLLSDRLELLTLELQVGGRVLAQLLVLLVAVAMLGVTAWLALCACAVGALHALGLHWAGALLIVLGVNLLIAALLLARMRRLAGRLNLAATRRHLRAALVPAAAAAAAAAHAEEPVHVAV